MKIPVTAGCAEHSCQKCLTLECAFLQVASDCGRRTPRLGPCSRRTHDGRPDIIIHATVPSSLQCITLRRIAFGVALCRFISWRNPRQSETPMEKSVSQHTHTPQKHRPHTYTHTTQTTHTHTQTHTHQKHTHTHTHTYTNTHTHTPQKHRPHTYTHTKQTTHTHTHQTHTQTHIHQKHTHTYTNTHTQTHKCQDGGRCQATAGKCFQ